MTPEVPIDLRLRAGEWDALHRWERAELGRALRRLGLTYGEIREIVPVPKGTLSYWCRDIRLSPAQVTGIWERSRASSREGIPVDTQWRRRLEIERIRAGALNTGYVYLSDPLFVGGVALYWAEGSKSRNRLDVANSDPALLRAFVAFVRRYLDPCARFGLSMHLHEGNDEITAQAFWREATGLVDAPFSKTFIKPKGTGHRKNHLEHGVCTVRVRNAADHWQRMMVWIELVADRLGPTVGAHG